MSDPANFLVVEDDPVDATAVLRILKGLGTTEPSVDTASSLADAKGKIHKKNYDAVILDLGLPDSQGIESVLDLQASAPELPLVVLSGTGDEATALKSVDIGAEDFLNKDSLTRSTLDKALKYAIERHKRKREIYRDMVSMKSSLDGARQEADTDFLTSLPNRRGLSRYLGHLNQAFGGQPVIVGLADLDQFKHINDEFGHDLGDAVLEEFVSRLQRCLRSSDFSARVGGDEFVVLFGPLEPSEAEEIGQRIVRQASSKPLSKDGRVIPFSVTLALAEMSPPFSGLEEILNRTHALMVSGKQGGRDRMLCSWGIADEAKTPGAPPTERIHQVVREVVPLSARATYGHYLGFGTGAEACPLPGKLLGQARLARRLRELTMHFLRSARDWDGANGPGGALHLDIEPEVVDPAFCAEIGRLFGSADARRRCVLYTHSGLSGQPGAGALSDLLLLRKAGFSLGLRGLGSGSTALESLAMLQPDWVRFDPSLTYGLAQHRDRRGVLRRLLEMLRLTGARFVAEEARSEDHELLQQLGIDAAYSEAALTGPLMWTAAEEAVPAAGR